MKQIFKPVILACCLVMFFTACKKEKRETAPLEISVETLLQIRNLGFSTEGIKKEEGGYMVEGDIFLPEADLQFQSTSPNMVIAQEEQYRTFKVVNSLAYPKIKVNLNKNSSAHQRVLSASLKEAIKRFNSQHLTIKFQHGNSANEHTTITTYNEESNTLASAGFPTNNGAPFNSIRINTYNLSASTSEANINYIATIIAHELGHCIGFRHTDYTNRAYSCGGSASNEGQSTTGVGAVHIPGTPTGANSGSWMLACIGNGVNRVFNTNDITALRFVY